MRAGNDVILQNRPPLILFEHAKVLCFAVLYRKGVQERDSKRVVFFCSTECFFQKRNFPVPLSEKELRRENCFSLLPVSRKGRGRLS